MKFNKLYEQVVAEYALFNADVPIQLPRPQLEPVGDGFKRISTIITAPTEVVAQQVVTFLDKQKIAYQKLANTIKVQKCAADMKDALIKLRDNDVQVETVEAEE